MIYRELDSEEEKSFRTWARDNYKVGSPIQGHYHPVIQDECVKMNIEFSQLLTCYQSE